MPYIIMKYDDLCQETLSPFSRVANFSMLNKTPISMGLIGSSLEDDNAKYFYTCKSWADAGIELWNHGYEHTDEEFSTNTIERQRDSISKTQALAKEKLGIELSAFGSPHNNSTETTILALKEAASEIKNYLFAVDGEHRTSARQLLVRCNMEIRTGDVNFDFFIHNYEILKDLPYMIIQGHPGFWKEKDFAENEKILLYLKKQGNVLITPSHLPDIEKNKCDFAEEIIDKIVSANEFALYGAGQIGREFFRFARNNYGILPKCFVVSDGQSIHEKKICGVDVMRYSDFKKMGDGIAVFPTLMPEYHKDIQKMVERDGIQFISIADQDIYLELINKIRWNIFE